jgi:hypothetical protein
VKRLTFREMTLVSFKTRRARRIQFDRDRTLIVGSNHTGKSALLKSLYHTLGATPPKLSAMWREADVASLVRLSVGEHELSVLHYQGGYSVFRDGATEPSQVFRRVTDGLGPHLAALLDVGLSFVSRDGDAEVIAPPAYQFLPYYVDQDGSWARNWSSFERLQQFQGYRKDVAEYHTGIRPNEYYQLRRERDVARRALERANGEIRALRSARERLEARVPRTNVTLDVTAFQAEIARLLAECQRLAQLEEEYAERMRNLRNHAIAREQELAIARHAVNDTSADFRFASEAVQEDHIDCPTCGASYPNTFIERFEIARDENRCRELVLQIEGELQGVRHEIAEVERGLAEAVRDRTRVEAVLSERQGDVRLEDVLGALGREQVDRAFTEEVQLQTADAVRHERQVREQTARLNQFGKSPRRNEILDFYRERMRAHLVHLDVRGLTPSAYQAIDAALNQLGGSNGPRVLLAYYYAILHTIAQYGSGTFCPVVIDSPNQQGQDEVNLAKMLTFILQEQPRDSQLILGVETLAGVDPADARVIALDRPYGLLRAEEYPELEEEMWARVRSTFRLASQK